MDDTSYLFLVDLDPSFRWILFAQLIHNSLHDAQSQSLNFSADFLASYCQRVQKSLNLFLVCVQQI